MPAKMLNSFVAFPLQIVCQLILPSNVTFGNSSLDSLFVQQTTDLPEGYMAYPDIGVAYKYFGYDLTWNAARKSCIEQGGYLAIVDTFKKIEHIMHIEHAIVDLHVGIHRMFDSTEWTSVKTGLPLTVDAWAPVRNLDETNSLCMALLADGSGVTADNCSKSRQFICEIPLSMK